MLPGAVAARELRRELCIVTTVILAAGLGVIALVPGPAIAALALAVIGLTLLGTLPVVLDWSEIHVGPERAGTATGLLLLAGNLGGVLVVLSVQVAIGNPRAALAVLALWAVPGLLASLWLPRHAGTHVESGVTL